MDSNFQQESSRGAIAITPIMETQAREALRVYPSHTRVNREHGLQDEHRRTQQTTGTKQATLPLTTDQDYRSIITTFLKISFKNR